MGSLYDAISAQIPSTGLIFLNYGLDWEVPGADRVAPWLRNQRRQIQMIRFLTRGLSLKGRRLLEIGCGRGGNCIYLHETAGARAVGLDLCAGNVAFCRRVHRAPRLHFLRGDAQRLPFADDTFDVVVNLESSHAYAHFSAFWAEVERTLKSGGVFCYADLWGLATLPIDWEARARVLDEGRLQKISEEDVTQAVARSLAAGDGFFSLMEQHRTPQNGMLIDKILRTAGLLLASLLIESCTYKCWRFKKP